MMEHRCNNNFQFNLFKEIRGLQINFFIRLKKTTLLLLKGTLYELSFIFNIQEFLLKICRENQKFSWIF